jgi:hypothetical protein
MTVTARLAARLKGWLAPYLLEDKTLSVAVMLYALTQLASIAWDLPCMYGWENDGIAPRDLFGGLAFNLTPGNGHRYPLLHYLLLALLAWPVVLVAALRAHSWRLPDLMQSVLSVPALTGIAVVAKLVAVAMGCMTLLALARIARRTCSVSASRWAAAFAALNLSLSYYGRVSNVDGPYMMWVALSLDRLLDVLERGELRDYRGFGICAAAALATKDQAYGVYALTLPIYCVLLPALAHALPIRKALHWRRVGSAALVGGVSYGLMSGAFLNPTGFVHRVHLLTGENSQDWRRYERSAAGVWANLSDVAHAQAEFFWSWPVVMLAWVCVIVICVRPAGPGLQARSARLLPMSFALSSLLTFTLVAARCEQRFVLPLGLALAYYTFREPAAQLALRADLGAAATSGVPFAGAASHTVAGRPPPSRDMVGALARGQSRRNLRSGCLPSALRSLAGCAVSCAACCPIPRAIQATADPGHARDPSALRTSRGTRARRAGGD